MFIYFAVYFLALAKRRKSYRHLSKIYAATALAALLFFAYVIFLIFKSHDETVVEYNAFGISVPRPYQIHGIDVSRYQELISWEAVCRMESNGVKVGFAIIKATEGVNLRDPFFKRNWKKAKEAGLTRGAYHFFLANKDVKAQVKNFRKAVKLESGDLPPVLDVEHGFGLPPAVLKKRVKQWLDAIEAAYGVKPIIYTYVDFYQRYLKGSFDDYPLWVAHYFEPEKPRIGRPWTFWQHNDGGRVNGILTKVDFNVFNGDSAAFRALLLP